MNFTMKSKVRHRCERTSKKFRFSGKAVQAMVFMRIQTLHATPRLCRIISYTTSDRIKPIAIAPERRKAFAAY